MTRTELETLSKAVIDPFFYSRFVNIVHPIKGKVIFDLYPFQYRVIYDLLNNRFNVVLKARQMGLTEIIAFYSLWLASLHPYKNIQIISLKDRVAKKVMRRIKFMYTHLPHILQTPIVNGRPGAMGSASEMVFDNGSTITSIPTTEDAGRSEAVSLLVMDEAAIMQYAEIIWAAAFPTLSTGGAALINSTPYGVGGFFYETWSGALHGGNGFNPIKINWDLHPDRDIEWYKTMRRGLGAKRTAQEVDCDFLASGDNVFDLADIKAIEDAITYSPPLEKRLNGNLLIYHYPVKGKKYYLGADIATGRGNDYSSFTVMDEQGVDCAVFKGRVPINRFRDLLAKTAKDYNWALLAPETNDIGEGLTAGLQELGYPNLYYTNRLVKERNTSNPVMNKIPGWFTTGANRSNMIAALEEDIREEVITVNDPFFVNEAYTFIFDAMNRPVAMNKGEYLGDGDETYSDDSIMAKAITNFIRRGKQKPDVVVPPQ